MGTEWSIIVGVIIGLVTFLGIPAVFVSGLYCYFFDHNFEWYLTRSEKCKYCGYTRYKQN